jgi:hypothetical protein
MSRAGHNRSIGCAPSVHRDRFKALLQNLLYNSATDISADEHFNFFTWLYAQESLGDRAMFIYDSI